MEQRPHGEMKGLSGKGIVDRIKSWSHDNLTLNGRADKIYLKKYNSIAENLPKDITESQMALLELRLRQQSKSAAVGSVIIDSLVAGGALVGGAAVYGKLKDRAIAVNGHNAAARMRVDNRSRTVFQAVKDVSYNAVKTGMDVAMFGVKVVVTPIEWGAKIMFWPIRKVGEGGKYVWGLVGGPAMVDAAKVVGGAAVEAVKLPYTMYKDLEAVENKVGEGVKKLQERGAQGKAKRAYEKALNDWHRLTVALPHEKWPKKPTPLDFIKK